ncbi:hypothetical protein B0J13DRAFT_625908 [Dactylonectria estremocensis]|uniref:Uncharacterized protein n=1 Tax=Dactylonectria estremocensis TaxID=1079267 RepID=A0A9P9EBQ1_9HYPO|nr:hypothetical protein B0J13DRAFT_625908 [Dactylonectria estremocensis]
MDRTDEELDRDWQPSGRRPQSTIARSFSQELMDIFRIENSLTDLDEQVSEKKRKVNRNTQELASLEKRLREMEERLKRPNQPRASLPQVQQQQDQDQSFQSLDATVKDDQKSRSRPGTARAAQQAPSAGNMPPTPGASEGEYYFVTRADLNDGPR